MIPSPLGAHDPGGPGGPVELADRLAELTRAVPGVADLHGGVFGEVATYLPGRQVAGVRIEDDHVEIHVSVLWNESVRATAEQVSARLEEVAGRPVYVTVDDIVHPGFPDRDSSEGNVAETHGRHDLPESLDGEVTRTSLKGFLAAAATPATSALASDADQSSRLLDELDGVIAANSSSSPTKHLDGIALPDGVAIPTVSDIPLTPRPSKELPS